MTPLYSFVQSPNFKAGRDKPVSAIILHFTGGATLEGSVRWFQNKLAKVSAHYVVGRDGNIVQMVLEQDTAWHAGRSLLYGDPAVNSMSVGIEIVNWGELKKVGDEFFCWPAKDPNAPIGSPDREEYTRPYSSATFGTPKFDKGKWWAPYSLLQTVAVTKLCAEVCKRYPLITPERIVGHEDVAPGRKNDPGPLLNIDEIRRSVSKSKSAVIVGRVAPEDDVGDDQLYEAQEDRSGEG